MINLGFRLWIWTWTKLNKSVLGIKLFHSFLVFVCISIHFIQNEKNDALNKGIYTANSNNNKNRQNDALYIIQ